MFSSIRRSLGRGGAWTAIIIAETRVRVGFVFVPVLESGTESELNRFKGCSRSRESRWNGFKGRSRRQESEWEGQGKYSLVESELESKIFHKPNSKSGVVFHFFPVFDSESECEIKKFKGPSQESELIKFGRRSWSRYLSRISLEVWVRVWSRNQI